MIRPEWKKIQDRKWELKTDEGVVLGTIFHKPLNKKFSLWVSSPLIFAKTGNMGVTHRFETFDEAAEAFDTLCQEKAIPWCKAIVEYFGVEVRQCKDVDTSDKPSQWNGVNDGCEVTGSES